MGADHNQQMTVNTTPISSAFNSSNVDQKKPPKELQDLQKALQSGDLNAANQAFSQLGQVAKAHHHHGGQQAQSATQTQPTPTATSSDADRDGDGSGSASQIGKLNLSA